MFISPGASSPAVTAHILNSSSLLSAFTLESTWVTNPQHEFQLVDEVLVVGAIINSFLDTNLPPVHKAMIVLQKILILFYFKKTYHLQENPSLFNFIKREGTSIH